MNLFLLLILILVGIGLYRGWRVYSTIRRFMRNPAEEFERRARQQRRESTRSTGNPIFDMFFGVGNYDEAAVKVARKRIPRDVGEYVQFTDIKDSSTPQQRAPYVVEEQITDVEWEEIR